MNHYLPEDTGFEPTTYRTEQLQSAMERGTILRAAAILCDEHHDLYVDLGCCTGRIPREEAAIGIATGKTRDIAILTRVGKPVCFRVLSVGPKEALLSRRLAQEEALEALLCRAPGEILPAVVTNCTEFGAFCDVGCGVAALLGVENICLARIRHAAERFTQGQQIFAAIRDIDRTHRRIFLTHKQLLGTWHENASLFRQGQTVTGTVRSIQDYGVFVELTPNLSGLCDPDATVQVGDVVSVYIKSILPDRRKIKLALLQKLGAHSASVRRPLQYFLTDGQVSDWQYSDRVSRLVS